MVRFFLKIGALAALVFLAAIGYLYFNQHNMVFVPKKEPVSRAAYSADDMQEVHLNTEDHLELIGWYKPAHQHQATIVFFHGNAGHLGSRVRQIRPYLDRGYGVLLFSYRGYANNPGRPSEQGLYKDARSALQFIRNKHIAPQCVVFLGESLGSGVAVQMATELDVAGVILQSPYTSLPDVARFYYPWVPFADQLMHDHFDSAAKIQQVNTPILILHGDADQVVPFELGQTLYDIAKQPKEFIRFAGRNHNNLFADDMVTSVLKFIDKNANCQVSRS